MKTKRVSREDLNRQLTLVMIFGGDRVFNYKTLVNSSFGALVFKLIKLNPRS